MDKRGFIPTAILFIIPLLGSVGAQTANSCQTQTMLDNLKFTLLTTPSVNTAALYCKKTYPTKGACVDSTVVKTRMEEMVTFYKQKAIEAVAFGFQFANATVFFQKANGALDKAAVGSTSIFTVIGTAFKNFASGFMNLFNMSVAWIKSIFTTHISSINSCFNAWANITTGAICTLSSNAAVETVTAKTNHFVTLTVDTTTTVASLKACWDLIDTYCSITHGVSIKNSAEVFNTTISTDFADGGYSKDQCIAVRTHWAKTVEAEKSAALNPLLLAAYQSNYLFFVPSQASIDALGKYYTVATPDKTVKYTPVLQTNTVKGIGIEGSASATALNILEVGLNSGLPSHTYSSKIFGTSIIAVIALGLLSKI